MIKQYLDQQVPARTAFANLVYSACLEHPSKNIEDVVEDVVRELEYIFNTARISAHELTYVMDMLLAYHTFPEATIQTVATRLNVL